MKYLSENRIINGEVQLHMVAEFSISINALLTQH